MDFNSIINGVNSKEDFMNFLVELRRDKEQKSEDNFTLRLCYAIIFKKMYRQGG